MNDNLKKKDIKNKEDYFKKIFKLFWFKKNVSKRINLALLVNNWSIFLEVAGILFYFLYFQNLKVGIDKIWFILSSGFSLLKTLILILSEKYIFFVLVLITIIITLSSMGIGFYFLLDMFYY